MAEERALTIHFTAGIKPSLTVHLRMGRLISPLPDICKQYCVPNPRLVVLRDFHVFHRSVPSVVELAVLPLICIKKRCADCAANYKVPRTSLCGVLPSCDYYCSPAREEIVWWILPSGPMAKIFCASRSPTHSVPSGVKARREGVRKALDRTNTCGGTQVRLSHSRRQICRPWLSAM